eukprot:scaffold997_cov418-Prasinococcus_capsulatus_cf.AAC.3
MTVASVSTSASTCNSASETVERATRRLNGCPGHLTANTLKPSYTPLRPAGLEPGCTAPEACLGSARRPSHSMAR